MHIYPSTLGLSSLLIDTLIPVALLQRRGGTGNWEYAIGEQRENTGATLQITVSYRIEISACAAYRTGSTHPEDVPPHRRHRLW